MPRIPIPIPAYETPAGMKCIIDLTNDNEEDDPSYIPPSHNPSSPRRQRKCSAGPKQHESPKVKRSQTRLDSFVTTPSRAWKRQTTIDAFLGYPGSTGSQPTSKRTTLENVFSTLGRSRSRSPAPLPEPFEFDSSCDELVGGLENRKCRNEEARADALQIFATLPPSSPDSFHGKEVVQLEPIILSESTSPFAEDVKTEEISGKSNQRLYPSKIAIRPCSPLPTSSKAPTSPIDQPTKDGSSTIAIPAKCDVKEILNKRKFSEMLLQEDSVSSECDPSLSPDPLQVLELSPRIREPSFKRVDIRESPCKLSKSVPTQFRGACVQGSSTMSIKFRVGDPEISSNGLSREFDSSMPLFMTQARHTRLPSELSIQTDEIGDGHFEEYDPFDDTEEIAEIRRRTDPVPAISSLNFEETPPAIGPQNSKEAAVVLSLASRHHGRFKRRPYLSLAGRKFLRHVGPWSGFREFEGKLLHVDFTSVEVDKLMTQIKYQIRIHEAREGQVLDYDSAFTHCIRHVLDELPGRTEKDCRLFLKDWGLTYLEKESQIRRGYEAEDHAYLSWLPRDYIVLDSSSINKARNSRARLRLLQELGMGADNNCAASEVSQLLRIDLIDSMQPWKVFKEGSNDILDIAWSPDGMQFALGAATHSDVYNRAGNLVLGSISLSKVKLLHGHQERRPAPYGPNDPFLHSTVPAVKFAADGKLLFSGGYDKTVKVWDSSNGERLGSLSVEGPVVSLAVSPYHNYTVASGCQNGTLRLSSWNGSGSLDSSICTPWKQQTDLYPAYLAWGEGPYSNNLIVGYDTNIEQGKGSNAGSLLVFDAVSQQQIHKISPGAQRHFDIFSQQDTFLTGCGPKGTSGIRSHLRCYNYETLKCVNEFDSTQYDINRVTISPCGRFVTSSATDGSTFCWDSRNPNYILAKLWQNQTLMEITENTNLERDDTGVEVALWGETNDRLYTGGSDGIIKIWDIKRADPYVGELGRVNAQIMSGSFSPSRDMLMIGDASGTATLFSTVGNAKASPELFETEGAVIPDSADALESGEDPSRIARDAANDMLRTRRVTIGEGAYGYGAYGL